MQGLWNVIQVWQDVASFNMFRPPLKLGRLLTSVAKLQICSEYVAFRFQVYVSTKTELFSALRLVLL